MKTGKTTDVYILETKDGYEIGTYLYRGFAERVIKAFPQKGYQIRVKRLRKVIKTLI